MLKWVREAEYLDLELALELVIASSVDFARSSSRYVSNSFSSHHLSNSHALHQQQHMAVDKHQQV